MPQNHLAELFESTGKNYALIRLDRNPRLVWTEACYTETARSQPAFYQGALAPDGKLVVAVFIRVKALRDRLVKFGYKDVTGELRGEERLTPAPTRTVIPIEDPIVLGDDEEDEEEEDEIIISG